MTIFEYQRKRNGLFYSLLKLDKKVRNNTLIVILVGVFLLPKTAHLSTITEERIVELTNIQRSEAGLERLSINQLLTQAARAKAQAILDSDDFDHEISGRRFSSWVKDAGYEYSIVGENLAIDFVTSEGVLKAWRKSPDHLKNILSERYEDIGVAVVEGEYQGENTIVVAQIFGAPTKASIAQDAPIAEAVVERHFIGTIASLTKVTLQNKLLLPLISLIGNAPNINLLALAEEGLKF